MVGIVGKKIGMLRVFTDSGEAVGCTVLQAGPCSVVSLKEEARHGYNAVQLAYQESNEKRSTKPLIGHYRKAGVAPHKKLVEFRDFCQDLPGRTIAVADQILSSQLFAEGQRVDVQGDSKGAGFQGVVKAHGFGGGPETHGQHNRKRAPGSIGASSDPSRVVRGMRMAKRMQRTVTVKNMLIVKLIPEQHLIVVKGAVPGSNNSCVVIKK